MKLRTYLRLGLANVARVAVYRLRLKSGLHPVQRLQASAAKGPFYRVPQSTVLPPPANTAWDEALCWFGWRKQSRPETPPDWFENPFSDTSSLNAERDWWAIPDFGAGDIKGLWELSRFDWVVAWATVAAGGDEDALARLNLWLSDWAQSNPPYKGPNWKCGQEASIRVMHLITAVWILEQDREPEQGLVDLLIAHIQRIAPTMSYAIGQQNNHGTSEAAALFIGGSFLIGHDPRAELWARKGRRWLEERAQKLIEPDGSFSQYSVTYHRFMLDTYSLVEAWRLHREQPSFSKEMYERLGAATNWLLVMTDAKSGDAPNIGANDGARLIQLTDSDYRDFRPSGQLAAALFQNADAYGAGGWTAPLRWLGVQDGRPRAAPESKSFDDGGYHVLRTGDAMAVLRYPRFRFRPSQADALHLDLWHNGTNLLRDAGTFSYNAKGAEWFSSSSAHNTIVFDGRDQMPRLGRFLFGQWLDAEEVESVRIEGGQISAAAAYTDAEGATHKRAVSLTPEGLVCRDWISGPFEEAVLTWRLAPGEWRYNGDVLAHENYSVSIEADGISLRPTLEISVESRYYQKQSEIPVATVRVRGATTLVTKVTF
ncbi:heparinase II/III family protein [Roseovarius nubinhibens]|uniref:heparinase II/III family protein n=1 Tax=Roseovarius nubinhibens TaxID=314263 RepID=UPI001C084A02|nr:heparinase II/III-family protein [Roseovarius nubinhibens]